MGKFSFPKKDRLKSRKSIERLFKEGKTVYFPPVKMFLIREEHSDGSFIKAGFSVPKRNFKKAVDRNLLKRRMREAYRLLKPRSMIYFKDKNISLSVFFVYLPDAISDFQEISSAVENCMNAIQKKM